MPGAGRAELLVAAALACAGTVARAEPVSIGVAAAVRGTVTAKAAERTRAVQGGHALFADDLVHTGPDGRLQALLKDETAFTLGPNASLLLDRFVYDPRTGLGQVSAKVTEGVFRFITGKVAGKTPSSMKVTLPVGSMGIEGTIVAGSASRERTTIVLLGPGPSREAGERIGSVVVTHAGRSVRLSRPGFGTVLEPGRPPQPPFRVSNSVLRDLMAALVPSAVPVTPERAAVDPARGAVEAAGAQLAAAAGMDANGLLTAASNALGATGLLSSHDSAALVYRFSDPAALWENLKLLQGLGSLPFNGNGVFTGNASIATPLLNFPAVAVNVDYSSLAGLATSRVAIPGGGTCTAATCNVTFSLRNADGFAGKVLDGSATFNNGVFSGAGAATATRPY